MREGRDGQKRDGERKPRTRAANRERERWGRERHEGRMRAWQRESDREGEREIEREPRERERASDRERERERRTHTHTHGCACAERDRGRQRVRVKEGDCSLRLIAWFFCYVFMGGSGRRGSVWSHDLPMEDGEEALQDSPVARQMSSNRVANVIFSHHVDARKSNPYRPNIAYKWQGHSENIWGTHDVVQRVGGFSVEHVFLER